MSRKKKSLVENYRSLAAVFLSEHQKANKIPKNFSGIISPKFGEYILVMQYDKNQLVGAVVVKVENAKALSKRIEFSATSHDYLNLQEEGNIEEVTNIDGNDPSS